MISQRGKECLTAASQKYFDKVVRLEGGLLMLVHATDERHGNVVGAPCEGQDMARNGARQLL